MQCHGLVWSGLVWSGLVWSGLVFLLNVRLCVCVCMCAASCRERFVNLFSADEPTMSGSPKAKPPLMPSSRLEVA